MKNKTHAIILFFLALIGNAGTPTGTNVKDGNGISMNQSLDGKVIISKTTYVNGVAVKTEDVPRK